jgi:hypothetical protein
VDGKLQIRFRDATPRPLVFVRGNRILVSRPTAQEAELAVWTATPTGTSSARWQLPTLPSLAEFLATTPSAGATGGASAIGDGIQVKRSDAAYLVVEEISSVFSQPSDQSKVAFALEFGDRVRVVKRVPPFIQIEWQNQQGYIYQRDIVPETDLTTAQKDRIRRLGKDSPGNIDSANARFGWKDDDRISYSSYGRRDPFVEVKPLTVGGISIDQVSLVGIIWNDEDPMVILEDLKAHGISYTLHEGDTVQNGKVLKISPNDVMFLLHEYGVTRRYSMTLPDKYGGNKK